MGNSEWLHRTLGAVWHPCTQMKQHEQFPPVPISHGAGVWLYDFEGNRYLDAISSWWVNLFGHCNARINEALRDQLERLEHVMLAGFTHEPVVRLSERLAALAPRGLGHCFYGSDGASATEIALKMSFHFWRNRGKPAKTSFLSLANSYHGETLGALSVTDVALFKDTYAPLLREAAQVPSPDARNGAPGESARAVAERAAQALEDYLAAHHERVAAFIVEPLVQCAGGMGMYDAHYLARAREICDRFDVHLIADEIAVGFGRTGSFFACEQAGIRPDFLCLSKGITGGYLPLAVVMTTDPVFAAFYHDEASRGFLHSHSYTGNALACRAALASLDIFEQDGVLDANRQKADYLSARLAPLEADPRVRNLRHLGMIWAFELADPRGAAPQRVHEEGLRRHVLLRPIGETIYLMPPYVICEPEMDFLAEGLLGVLQAL
ncbi:MAG: adenosylmethionine--8-amino-7-oxononanoate transaminase [Betaproteobacteria bacterium]|nr:adenosylmethionine--8-amino-7-oxononanoate transaminase [Betaproteobacteria bacterium]